MSAARIFKGFPLIYRSIKINRNSLAEIGTLSNYNFHVNVRSMSGMDMTVLIGVAA